ncbi:MAG: metallophosphoesterase [Euryarchaeota archaeon]|nr:metallophosphoesterase [Euryarchaeota archaeon]
MLVGIISDSHDNLSALEKAVRLLNREGVEHVLHAGDIIAPFAAAKLAELEAKLTCVYGNNDGERALLAGRLSEMGAGISDFAELVLAERRIALYHGTIAGVTSALVESGRYDVVVTGHTHRAEVRRRETCLAVNPGELCGYLTGRRSLCLLDLETMEARILEV